MPGTVKRCLPFALAAALSAWIAFATATVGDYPADAGPAVHALARGDVAAFLSHQPDMGPVSVVLRAPFAALAGGGRLDVYRWGSLPCVLAAALLGLYLAGLARRSGAGPIAQAALAAVCVVNPVTFNALRLGHPEEILTAALAVGAVAVAAEGHGRRAALLLGLALACKQWAAIAILPTLMALPARRLAVGMAAAGLAAVLVLPGVLADPHGFFDSQRNLAVDTVYAGPWSAWYPLAEASTRPVAGLGTVSHTHYAPDLVARLSHALIVLAAVAVPLALALRRRRFGLSGGDAMALLALLALVRCILDPVDNLYYHAPLLLALAGWDAMASRGLPIRALAAAAVAELLTHWAEPSLGTAQFNAVYLAVAASAGIAICVALAARGETRASAAAGKLAFRRGAGGGQGYRLRRLSDKRPITIPRSH